MAKLRNSAERWKNQEPEVKESEVSKKTPLYPTERGLSIPTSILSADKLRVKSGRTMVACVDAGHSKYLRKLWVCANEVGQLFAAQGLTNLQGKGLVRKEAFLMT